MNRLIPEKFVSIFCGLIFTLLLIGCSDYKGKEIILKNRTADVVTIKKIHYPQDIELVANKSATVFVDYNGEGFDLEVVWKGETYVGDTGYVQDCRKITIEFLEDMDIKVTVKIVYDDFVMEHKLTKIES